MDSAVYPGSGAIFSLFTTGGLSSYTAQGNCAEKWKWEVVIHVSGRSICSRKI